MKRAGSFEKAEDHANRFAQQTGAFLVIRSRAICALVLLCSSAVADGKDLQRVPWNRSAEVFAAEVVIVQLKSGTAIRGAWVSVTPDSFQMKVTESSRKNAIAEGLQVLPRAEIATVWVKKKQARGRVIGSIAGFFAVGELAAWAIVQTDPHVSSVGGPVVAGLIGIGGATAGYWIGKKIDHKAARRVILVD